MRCTACHKSKSKSEFYKNRLMASGYLNQCKSCVKKRVKKRRLTALDEYRARDRIRSARSERVAARSAYQKTQAGRSAHYRATKKWVAANRSKRMAHIAVNNAIRSGRLTRKSCYKCGNPKSQAHHEDYNKPLHVTWCCAKHHRELHV